MRRSCAGSARCGRRRRFSGDVADIQGRYGGDTWRIYHPCISLNLPVSPCISPDQAEAAKREQWMAEKTKEIKDSTVRCGEM